MVLLFTRIALLIEIRINQTWLETIGAFLLVIVTKAVCRTIHSS